MRSHRCALATVVLILCMCEIGDSASCSSLDGPFCALLTGQKMPDYALALIAAEPERQARSLAAEADNKGAIEQITQALLAAASQVAKQIREGKAGKVAKAERARKTAGTDSGDGKSHAERDVKARGKPPSSFPVPSAVRDKLSKGLGSKQQPFEVDEQGDVVAAAPSAASDSIGADDDDGSVVVVRASLPSDDGSQQTIEIRVVAAGDVDDEGDSEDDAEPLGEASTAAPGDTTAAAPAGKRAAESTAGRRSSVAAGSTDIDDADDEGSEFIHLLADGDVSALLRAARQAMTAEDELDAAAEQSPASGKADSDGSDDEDSESKMLLSVARMAARQMRQSLSRRLSRGDRKASVADDDDDNDDDD